MRFFITLCLLLLAAVADAGIFEWVDSNGVTHFTDNPDNIPAKYQKKVKERSSAPTESPPVAPAPSTAPQPPPDSKVGEEQRLRGGHDEWWWRAGFSEIRRELDGIQSTLAGKREQLSTVHRKRVIYQRARDRVAYNELDADIKQDVVRLRELEDRLVNLEAEADRADVPQKWRR
ncbi:MAG: DUF4124 domain-containing protein [Geobacteraceae bacterium]